MKLAVVGGGSTYTPELVDGLGRPTDAGQSGVTGPVSAAATASALAAPVASSTRCRASRMVPSPWVTACVGTGVDVRRTRALSRRVVSLSATTRLRESSGRRRGSLKARWPLRPIPSSWRSTPPSSRDPPLELLTTPLRHHDVPGRQPERARRSRGARTPRTTPGGRPAGRRTRPAPPRARRRSPHSPGPVLGTREAVCHPSRPPARAPDPAQQSGERAPQHARRQPRRRRPRPRPCAPRP